MSDYRSLESGGHSIVFISTASTAAAESIVPHPEVLKKWGRIGVCLANNRAGLVKLVIALILLSLVGIFVRCSVGLVKLAANGLNVRSTFVAPWTSGESTERTILELISSDVSVAGQTVKYVVEPMLRISMVKHISLLIIGLKKNVTDRLITRRDVENGYLQWKPMYSELSANFTLKHAHNMLRNDEAKTNDSSVSVCFVEYGLPYNVVYLPKSDMILYEPKIESKSRETLKIKSSCEFKNLVEKFFFANGKEISVSSFESLEPYLALEKKNASEWIEVPKSGAVSFIDRNSTIRQQVFGVPEFQGIDHCIELYKMLLEPLKKEIVF